MARKDARGMVTAETAMALPALLLLLAIALFGIVAVTGQMKAIDGAREAARIAARGDSDAAAVRAGTRLGPHAARVVVQHRASWVDVTVTAPVRPFRWLPTYTARASATAESEQR